MQRHAVQREDWGTIGGLGCFGALILIGLMSRLVYADFDQAFSLQLPLTLSGDAGAFAALVAVAAFSQCKSARPILIGFIAGAVLFGLGFSQLLKAGMVVGPEPMALIVGDALSGFFALLCAFLWWCDLRARSLSHAVVCLASGLALAVVLFLAAGALPDAPGKVGAPLLLVVAMGVCVGVRLAAWDGNLGDPAASDDTRKDTEPRGQSVTGPVIIVLALAFFVADFELDLFPVSLYFEDIAYGTLPTPAVAASVLMLAFAAILFVMGWRQSVGLSFLYTTGFLLVALGLLLTPYRLSGGFPLAAAEAGRAILVVFAIVLALRFAESMPPARSAAHLFLPFAFVMLLAMLAADGVVIALQLQDGFDYSDFTFRTLFASVGIAVLVVLLLGPLPRVRELLAAPTDVSEHAHGADAPDRCGVFADRFSLSTRETEVLRLIAAGRDVPYIENELVLAKSTVKTHIKHIYEKCGVSSRQDLLDALEECGSERRLS